MTDMIGMDVEAVRRIAGELRRKAGDLRAIDGRVDAVVGQIDGNWQGTRARQFVYDWHNHHRSALRQLSDRIEGLGQSALNNAAEQEQASGGGAASAGSGSAGSGNVFGRAAAFLSAAALPIAASALPFAKGLLKAGAKLSGNEFSVGRYTNSWNKILKFTDGLNINGHRVIPEDLLRFKRSPVTQALNQYQDVLKGGQSVVGKVSGYADIATHGADSYFAFQRGDVRDGVADGVNTATRVGDQIVGKSLVGRLAMIDARLWTEVGRAATNPEIDYSWDGIKQVATASPLDWGVAIGQSLPEFGKTLFKKVL